MITLLSDFHRVACQEPIAILSIRLFGFVDTQGGPGGAAANRPIPISPEHDKMRQEIAVSPTSQVAKNIGSNFFLGNHGTLRAEERVRLGM